MRRILDLMRVDIITINGGKNNIKTILILLFVVFGVLGFVFSPIIGLYCPLVVGGFFGSMIFQGEQKFHTGKLWGLLPIRRRDLVNARFALSITAYSALFLIIYFLMLLAEKLKIFYLILGEEADELDLIAIIVEYSGGGFTELGLFNLLFFGAFAFGLIFMTGSLRKHFKDGKTAEMSLKRATKKEYVYLLLSVVLILLLVLIVTGVLPIGPAILVFVQIFAQLAQAANGFLLGAVLVTIAVFSAVFKYICTILEYDEKEL